MSYCAAWVMVYMSSSVMAAGCTTHPLSERSSRGLIMCPDSQPHAWLRPFRQAYRGMCRQVSGIRASVQANRYACASDAALKQHWAKLKHVSFLWALGHHRPRVTGATPRV